MGTVRCGQRGPVSPSPGRPALGRALPAPRRHRGVLWGHRELPQGWRYATGGVREAGWATWHSEPRGCPGGAQNNRLKYVPCTIK